MFMDTTDKYLIRRQAWLEAVRLCGGVTAYSKRMNILRSRVSNWINQTEIDIPYQFSVVTWAMTQVGIDRLSPFTESANQIMRGLNTQKPIPVELPLHKIVIDSTSFHYVYQPEQSIMIDTDGLLISGLAKIKAFEALGVKKVEVMILDLKSWILGLETSLDNYHHFLLSERVAIGLRLEQLLGERQGQRSDVKPLCITKNLQPSRICDEVKGRTDSIMAKLIGFNSKDTYRRAKQVYQHGIAELIHLLDGKQISIAKAAKIARFSKECQLKTFKTLTKRSKSL